MVSCKSPCQISALLLFVLVCTHAKEDKHSRFPVALVVHGGYRPTMGADVTLYRLAANSYLYSFFTQFKKTPPQPLEIVLWVDTSSYEDHIPVLEQLLHNLQSLMQELITDYSWVKPRINFSRGIAESYHRSLRLCTEQDWCKYLMFTEDDWLFEYSNIKHSAADLLDVMDDHDWVNYIRFNKRELKAILFDSPCVVEDKRLPIPLTNTAGFSNNAHLCKAAAVQRLFELVHDARTSGHNWGLECHEDMAKLGMFALCHNIIYACRAEQPFVQNYAVCDYKTYVVGHGCAETKWASEHYKQVNATLCANDRQRQPRYDHCGLYLYGAFNGPPSASHLQGEGENFDLQQFNANPVSKITGERLPYIKQSQAGGFFQRLQHIMSG